MAGDDEGQEGADEGEEEGLLGSQYWVQHPTQPLSTLKFMLNYDMVGRLDATESSLTRVQDLLREVRRQLRPLERQADAARRHGDGT